MVIDRDKERLIVRRAHVNGPAYLHRNLLVGMHCIKQITCLHKQINTLAYREICRLLKSVNPGVKASMALDTRCGSAQRR